MFTHLFKTPTETMNAFTEYFSLFPKTESEITAALEKVKAVFQTEIKNSTSLWNTYQKVLTGEANFQEITQANKKLQRLLISTRFGAFMAIPGAVFMLPALIKFAKDYNVDIIPDSVKDTFKL